MDRGSLGKRIAQRRIAAVARRMPARQRAIFLAVALEDASYAEIGRRIGLDQIAVEQEFARALVDLAAAIDPRPSWWGRARRWVAARIGGWGWG